MCANPLQVGKTGFNGVVDDTLRPELQVREDRGLRLGDERVTYAGAWDLSPQSACQAERSEQGGAHATHGMHSK